MFANSVFEARYSRYQILFDKSSTVGEMLRGSNTEFGSRRAPAISDQQRTASTAEDIRIIGPTGHTTFSVHRGPGPLPICSVMPLLSQSYGPFCTQMNPSHESDDVDIAVLRIN